MALGGGSFTFQNKVLPGSYINFVSATQASSSLSDRGVATMGLELDWGCDGEVFAVTQEEFIKNSMEIFGYDYTSSFLAGLRDLFMNLQTLYCYRLNSGEKASCVFGSAVCSGERGNDIKIVIQDSESEGQLYGVYTYIGDVLVDKQDVSTGAELVDNSYVKWVDDVELSLTAGVMLEGGSSCEVNASSHQKYLEKIECYPFNILGVNSCDDDIKKLYVAFTKNMRDSVGSKFQTVVYNCNADYEGVINLSNSCVEEEAALVYWVTGLQAGCAVNKSCLNRIYDGEFTVNCNLSQTELGNCIAQGQFTLHKVGTAVRVLADCNSLVSFSADKGEVFADNQTIRVVDQIACDIANLFNSKYLGVIPNDASGRISLWADIVKHHKTLSDIRAIENFDESHITVSAGDSKKSVVVSDVITVVNTMAQLYMTVTVG